MEGEKGKRYYWLRLHDDFFDQLHVKKLRRTEGGAEMLMIYQMMLLGAIKSDGALIYRGVESGLAAELALAFDVDEESVRRTLDFLESRGLAERDGEDCFLPEAAANVGSETASAQRVREHRGRAKAAKDGALQSNGAALQRNADVTETKRAGNAEKEKKKEKETETEIRDRRERENKRESGFTGEGTSPSSAFVPANGPVFSREGNGALPAALSRAAPPSEGRAASAASCGDAPSRGTGSACYGEYGNVMLTDAEYAKVKAEFPSDWRARIDGLSAYVASTGKKYKSHFATIRNWARMERERAAVRGQARVSDNPFLDIAREEGII